MRQGDRTELRRSPFPVRVFFVVWLLLWTCSILWVLSALLSGGTAAEGQPPLITWLVISAGGWLLGAWLLIRALSLRPRPKRSNSRDDEPVRMDPNTGRDGDNDGGGSDGD